MQFSLFANRGIFRSMKIGLYGGSFDPIHLGHLILAREALERLELDQVVFIPAAVSPHKLHAPPVSAQDRFDMVAAAIEGEQAFTASDCEMRRHGPSFSVDTVRSFQDRLPEARLFYFIGSDNLPELHTWKEIATLRRMAEFVVFRRNGTPVPEGWPTVERHIDISSTEIRNRIACGLSVRYLVPEKVGEIIVHRRLYQPKHD